jgi:hypothetical protein
MEAFLRTSQPVLERASQRGPISGIGIASGESLPLPSLGAGEDSSVWIEQQFVRAERCG